MPTRHLTGPVELPCQRPVKDVVDESRLPASGNPRDRREEARREPDREVREIVLRGAGDRQPPRTWAGRNGRTHANAGNGDPLSTAEEHPRQGAGVGHDLSGCPASHDLTAPGPRSGPHVQDMVCREDRLLVMLDDDDGVPQIAEPPERVKQAVVIALVEADARFVENVEDTGKPRADLGGQTDPLGLSTRECAAFTAERQVTESHLDKESESGRDLADQVTGDLSISLREVESVDDGPCLRRRESTEGDDVPFPTAGPLHGDAEDLRTQSRSSADGARLAGEEGLQAVLLQLAFGGLHLALDHRDQAFKGFDRHRPAAGGSADFLSARAVKKKLLEPLGKFAEGDPFGGASLPRKSCKDLTVVGTHPLVGSSPRPHRALLHRLERQVRINEESGIAERFGSEPLTGGAGPEMAVEGKVTGCQTRHGEASRRIAEIG